MENKKYAMVFICDATAAGGNIHVDKIILFNSKEEAENKLDEFWDKYFNEKIEELKKHFNKENIYVNKDRGSIQYWSENEEIDNFEAYSIVIKEIDEN